MTSKKLAMTMKMMDSTDSDLQPSPDKIRGNQQMHLQVPMTSSVPQGKLQRKIVMRRRSRIPSSIVSDAALVQVATRSQQVRK